MTYVAKFYEWGYAAGYDDAQRGIPHHVWDIAAADYKRGYDAGYKAGLSA